MKIAYVNIAGPATDGEIWTIKPKGGGKHRVTNNASNDHSPYWGVNNDCSLLVAPEWRAQWVEMM